MYSYTSIDCNGALCICATLKLFSGTCCAKSRGVAQHLRKGLMPYERHIPHPSNNLPRHYRKLQGAHTCDRQSQTSWPSIVPWQTTPCQRPQPLGLQAAHNRTRASTPGPTSSASSPARPRERRRPSTSRPAISQKKRATAGAARSTAMSCSREVHTPAAPHLPSSAQR